MTALAVLPWQMRAEIDLFGFYVPWWLLLGVASYILAFAVARILERLNWLRHIWHPPLFFVALMALCFSLLGLFLTR